MPELTGRCPICEAELVVTHLQCDRCGTGLQGSFTLNKFDRLSREQLRFVDVFVKNRGVIRDVERELGISYPTVRSRLDEVIRELGYDAAPEGAGGPPGAGQSQGQGPGQSQSQGRGARQGPEQGGEQGVTPERRREILDQLASGEVSADQAVQLLRGGAAPTAPPAEGPGTSSV